MSTVTRVNFSFQSNLSDHTGFSLTAEYQGETSELGNSINDPKLFTNGMHTVDLPWRVDANQLLKFIVTSTASSSEGGRPPEVRVLASNNADPLFQVFVTATAPGLAPRITLGTQCPAGM